MRARDWWTVGAAAVAILLAPHVFTNAYETRVGSLLLIYALFAISLDLVMGWTGQISLGHAGFFALGAYAEGIGQTQFHLSPWLAMAAGILAGAVCGFILAAPALRVRGPYLAMVTIGFGLTVQSLIDVAQPLTQGAMGISGIAGLALPFAGASPLVSYHLAGAWVVAALAGLAAVVRGPIGTMMAVVRERETLARACGVDVRRVKIAAFVASAALAGAAGATYATTLGFISPESFSIDLSIFAVVACVLGGLGTIFGPLLGTAFLYGFQQLAAKTAQGDVLLFGILLMLLPLFLVRGVAGLWSGLLRRLRAPPPPAAPQPSAAQPGSSGIESRGSGTSTFALRAIERNFGALRALGGVSVEARSGEIVGIVGPNGAGKTTLLNIASGYYAPSGGSIVLDGRDLTPLGMHDRARLGVISTFQHPQLMDASTVLRNLEAGLLYGSHLDSAAGREERVRAIAADLGLEPLLESLAGDLAYGPRKIVEVARALVSRPRVLLLDEPTSGLGPHDVEIVAHAIRVAREHGVACVMADHRVEFVTRLCDRVIVLANGTQLAAGTPAEITSDPNVIEAYLGASAGASHG